MQEIWKPVAGFEGSYEVSNLGKVRSLDIRIPCRGGKTRLRKGRILRCRFGSDGYNYACLSADGIYKNHKIARLVAMAFCSKEDGKDIVNHVDGDKTNDLSSNLEWTDMSGNIIHAYTTGLRPRKSHFHKLSEHQVTEIRTAISMGETHRSLAKKYGVSFQLISNIHRRKCWNHLL